MPQTNPYGNDVLTLPVKLVLFLTSYIPLYIIIAVLNHSIPVVLVSFFIFAVVVLILFFLIYYVIGRTSGDYLGVDRVDNINSINIEYLVTYFLPFLNVSFTNPFSLLAMFIVFFIIGFIYVNSDMLYTNPTLNLLGFSVFKCGVKDDYVVIISRKGKGELSQSSVVKIGSKLYIGK